MRGKFVYPFSEGHKDMKSLLGGKGANLAEMTAIGLPVPQGFTITTEACNDYYDNGELIRPEILQEIDQALTFLEKEQGKCLGSDQDPLLVSVRSGAVFSMPGMMDTILNLGLNDKSVQGLIAVTQNDRFAYDSYRRFIQMFADVAIGISKDKFDAVLEKAKETKGIKEDTELSSQDLQEIVIAYKNIYLEETGEVFPQNPKEQLVLAIEAVFKSWNNPRAKVYRRLNDISQSLGTAVNIQAMVFGNMGENSGTGVAFTRNPSTGENKLFGEYLINAQGEDVVAGIRTPQSIERLKADMPNIYQEFLKTTQLLEKHYHDMQDVEFTIEKGKLFMLQTRNGKRTAKAAIKIAVDQVREGLISKKDAIMRIKPSQLEQVLHPTFAPDDVQRAECLTIGLPASPGAASGQVYFHAADAVREAKAGKEVILVRQETSPEDIEGMVSAKGIITARGGMTSHAAVVARGMGKPCVAGCSQLLVDEVRKEIRIDQATIKEGEFLSIDGGTGAVYIGSVPMAATNLDSDFRTFMSWVDEEGDMKVRSNADNARDARKALEFGAEGIGLCRTEHMFFDEERIQLVREMIVADKLETREKALAKLLPHQQGDFYELFKALDGKSCNIRLLDPPLHEFLPQDTPSITKLAHQLGLGTHLLEKRICDLSEFNPMLGHRGCRLAITYPEIYKMQARAIAKGAIQAIQEGYHVAPEIMVPLVSVVDELRILRQLITETVDQELEEAGISMSYRIGTMIEIPRACVTADEIAQEADFFSFGTNDLTQMGFGFSRDDAGKFLGEYSEKGILDKDPFQVLDQKGIGRLLEMAVKLGRQTKHDLKMGICGEHGGEAATVSFCYQQGLNYVSCSPFRIPIAKLAAAQAKISQVGNSSSRDQ
ncbi:pyruvate, phosphate dikinase [Streptococcus pseudoporcinus]|uniref:Pyruvate, phosphate dikinase n=1 Tax=Streptococcus pseudoporcinus TaxID=361101 RepID=A0A4U9Y6X9_9STRE|nr:pyruvate, phosphate dikinase [Streptococcus pseudoporcinus]VTS22113.1 pyruvate phosphate dikinase [Streptococcus pseudoporcinus]VUC70200.1 pyruvate phosphate dikinase [Streptococcus pseudoporcinus]VUD00226.1 pyruvate phosphate dikinase [Streptococcus pseudoporcinus]VUD00618.1 pyruvate phosphate dikinase [Streptococcus pseudoporcinus]